LTEKGEPYQLTAQKAETLISEFEVTRRCLLKMYHSNIQTHAGYLIGIIIGSLTLFSRLDTFFVQSAVSLYFDLIFWFLLWVVIIAGIWVILRIVYWTSASNYIFSNTLNDIREKFNSRNKRVYEHYKENPSFLL
jgi:uncharacterized membrane-anchored protein YhcB (DUF1043 family)